MMNEIDFEGEVTKLFAYKAEWLEHDMYELFTYPTYFPELKKNQSCVLIGGRGTGKTTVLKGLSYEGQKRLNSIKVSDWKFYGLYYKVDPNRVVYFKGMGLSEADWHKPFAHYFNLIIVNQLLKFIDWYLEESKIEKESINLDSSVWKLFQSTLSVKFASDLTDLNYKIKLAINEFEVYINNIYDGHKISLSIQGAPIDALIEAIQTIPGLEKKPFYFMIDEYEALLDYQQAVLNTYIKQSVGKPYCFKVGVRELGWRVKNTLDNQELRDPSDYRRISISEKFDKNFNDFAEGVCNSRLQKLYSYVNVNEEVKVRDLLPSLSYDEEAIKLGIEKKVIPIKNKLKPKLSKTQLEQLHSLDAGRIWFIYKWAETQNTTFNKELTGYFKHKSKWEQRYENYKYATLFTIRKNTPGLRKFYCGWDVYLKLASGNIRYLLQLVEESLREHIKTKRSLPLTINPITQTNAAKNVGQRNLYEVEGLDVDGSQIASLIRGLGRVFGLLALEPFGHASEINQFWIPDLEANEKSSSKVTSVEGLLRSAVSHLALIRRPSTKVSSHDPKNYDYLLHPLYSPLYGFSHRRKRKMVLSAQDIINLVEDPGNAIDEVLKRHNRNINTKDKTIAINYSEVKQLPLFDL